MPKWLFLWLELYINCFPTCVLVFLLGSFVVYVIYDCQRFTGVYEDCHIDIEFTYVGLQPDISAIKLEIYFWIMLGYNWIKQLFLHNRNFYLKRNACRITIAQKRVIELPAVSFFHVCVVTGSKWIGPKLLLCRSQVNHSMTNFYTSIYSASL